MFLPANHRPASSLLCFDWMTLTRPLSDPSWLNEDNWFHLKLSTAWLRWYWGINWTEIRLSVVVDCFHLLLQWHTHTRTRTLLQRFYQKSDGFWEVRLRRDQNKRNLQKKKKSSELIYIPNTSSRKSSQSDVISDIILRLSDQLWCDVTSCSVWNKPVHHWDRLHVSTLSTLFHRVYKVSPTQQLTNLTHLLRESGAAVLLVQ